MEIIKELSGHSGSKVYLIEHPTMGLVVRKIGNIERNVERLNSLTSLNLPVCKVLSHDGDTIDLEYIHGLDISAYLIRNSPKMLVDFLIDTIKTLSANKKEKDYRLGLEDSLQWVDDATDLPFTKKELLESCDLNLFTSCYHGDLTFDNILYSNEKFYLIDAVTTNYDSYIFDIAKLRQDLDCGWFTRNKKMFLDTKLNIIKNNVLEEFPEAGSKTYLIFMLLRVYLHTKENDGDRKFIINEVKKLWS